MRVLEKRVMMLFMLAAILLYCVSKPTTARLCHRRPHKGKKIISVSVFGHNEKYYTNLQAIAASVERVFGDGWILRIYTDAVDRLPPLLRAEVVDMTNVSFPVPANGRVWRFLPALDRTVGVFLSRDTDNAMIARDRDAVFEWLYNTSYECHVMRDHPMHKWPMMGGMWGFRGQRDLFLEQQFRQLIYSRATNYLADQQNLKRLVWPHVCCLAHDAYSCGEFEDSRTLPFPTQRDSDGSGVGVPKGSESRRECPLRCRRHPSWNKC